MGFPDPNPAKAREYYDTLVEECNKAQNAFVWVHKEDRENKNISNQLKVLMREFNRGKPPVYLVLNGCHNYNVPWLDEKQQVKERNADREKLKVTANEIVDRAGIQVARIIVSTDIQELWGPCRDYLFSELFRTEPKTSRIKLLARLQNEVSSLSSAEDRAQFLLTKQREAYDKAAEYEKSLESEQEALACGGALAATAGAICVAIPGAQIAGGILGGLTVAIAAAAKHRKRELRKAYKKSQESLQALREGGAETEELEKEADERHVEYTEFLDALGTVNDAASEVMKQQRREQRSKDKKTGSKDRAKSMEVKKVSEVSKAAKPQSATKPPTKTRSTSK